MPEIRPLRPHFSLCYVYNANDDYKSNKSNERNKKWFLLNNIVDCLILIYNKYIIKSICDNRNLFNYNYNNSRKFLFKTRKLFTIIMILLLTIQQINACGPGRGGGRRRSPRKLTPLVFKQHVPNVSENTLGASGLNEGKITREHPRFKELVPNYNPDIIFKDEEGTGADRLMTQRLKEKLNTLAISVMNQWPGVKLRVTEGWDEEGHHAKDSLHYEGRAVDITTSDRDRSKYGMLARLAVESGFDWVYYESRFHIHVSVKSEKSDPGRSGGCFNKETQVETKDGMKSISELNIGEQVVAINENGELIYSKIILFLDKDDYVERLFYKIKTDQNKTITLTESHLLFIYEQETFDNYLDYDLINNKTPLTVFARDLTIGQYLLTVQNGVNEVNTKIINLEKIINITMKIDYGSYAPLTETGNIAVNNVIASCYAIIDNQNLAHFSFLPVRLWSNIIDTVNILMNTINLNMFKTNLQLLINNNHNNYNNYNNHNNSDYNNHNHQNGIHWYPKILYTLGKLILPASTFF